MTSTSPLSHTELIFPQASRTISSTLTSLKRSNLSISNRLYSIKHDADFIQAIADKLQLPLIANERCGSWYIPPARKRGSVYFKSTDGHHGQWSFSLRRLNLQGLDVIGDHSGCIIVDSTRRGKSMPDALSKTIPIWIAVLNRVLFPSMEAFHSLDTPEQAVSASEHAQIENRLESFAADLRSLDLDLNSLRAKLRNRPLMPVWVSRDSDLPISSPSRQIQEWLPIVLCTASGQTPFNGRKPADYVQGAADDSESWAHGLTPDLFWKHHRQLLETSEDNLPNLIQSLIDDDGSVAENTIFGPLAVKSTGISIANNAAAELVCREYDIVISCSSAPNPILAKMLKSRYIHLACSTGKVGSRGLRTQLHKVDHLKDVFSESSSILVCCASGKDLAVGVALAILCCSCREDGIMEPSGRVARRDKTMVKKRLAWIVSSVPEAAPSRATLQSVNAFVLGQHIQQYH